MLARPLAVVCDMDGLLVDSERLERRVWLAAATEHGVEMSDERFATFVGHSGDESARMLTGYYGDAFDVAAFRATCHLRMRELVDAEGYTLRPGAHEFLHFVGSLGIPLALATSSGPALVAERLVALREHFAAVVTRADVAHGKPRPDLYLEAARRLGVDPSGCLAVEDSPTGARAALAAGMRTVVIPDLVVPPPEIRAQLVGVFDSLDALREAVRRDWSGAAP